MHGLHLSAHRDARAGGQRGTDAIDGMLDVSRHGTQIAATHRAEQIEHRLHVVMRDHAGLVAATDRAELAQLRRAALLQACGADAERNVRQRLERVHRILGHRHQQRIAHAVLRIEPEVRRRLPAA
ncbi:hypothetical protein D3C85_1533910 [compost metagenome]